MSGKVAKDSEASEELIAEHGDYLFRFAVMRVKKREVAEDLVQDTLLSAIRNWDGFEGRASVRTWLTGILRNKIIDFYRASAREAPLVSEPEELAQVVDRHFNVLGIWNGFFDDWAGHPEKHLENKHFFKALENCLSKLPETARRLFVMKVVDGLETEEICKVLGISESNSWVLMHRARMALRDCIEMNWIRS